MSDDFTAIYGTAMLDCLNKFHEISSCQLGIPMITSNLMQAMIEAPKDKLPAGLQQSSYRGVTPKQWEVITRTFTVGYNGRTMRVLERVAAACNREKSLLYAALVFLTFKYTDKYFLVPIDGCKYFEDLCKGININESMRLLYYRYMIPKSFIYSMFERMHGEGIDFLWQIIIPYVLLSGKRVSDTKFEMRSCNCIITVELCDDKPRVSLVSEEGGEVDAALLLNVYLSIRCGGKHIQTMQELPTSIQDALSHAVQLCSNKFIEVSCSMDCMKIITEDTIFYKGGEHLYITVLSKESAMEDLYGLDTYFEKYPSELSPAGVLRLLKIAGVDGNAVRELVSSL